MKTNAKKFPTASKFDYRNLIKSDNCMDEDKLQDYFNPELLIHLITSKIIRVQSPQLYNDTRKQSFITVLELKNTIVGQ